MNTTENPAPRQRGRPRTDSPRTMGLVIKLTPEEMEEIEKKAKGQNMPKARWIREIALAA